MIPSGQTHGIEDNTKRATMHGHEYVHHLLFNEKEIVIDDCILIADCLLHSLSFLTQELQLQWEWEWHLEPPLRPFRLHHKLTQIPTQFTP